MPATHDKETREVEKKKGADIIFEYHTVSTAELSAFFIHFIV